MSFLVDGVICLYIAICWIVSVYIIKAEHFTLWGLRQLLVHQSYFKDMQVTTGTEAQKFMRNRLGWIHILLLSRQKS